MKKYIGLLIGVLCSTAINACDICGCGSGSNYIGILPEFKQRAIGLRYRYNLIQTHLGSEGISYLTTKEQYQIAELWGSLQVGKKLRLMAVVPYTFNTRTNSINQLSQQGFGDISMMAHFQLLQKKTQDEKNKIWAQSLWVGGGIKIPTGVYKPSNKNQANFFQTGSGSTDFLMQAMYDLRKQDDGININLLYKINTTNKEMYLYGNRLSVATQYYHKWKLNKMSNLSPNAGLLYETSGADYNKGSAVFASGGNVLMTTLGLEYGAKNWIAGANFQLPITQQLANDFAKSGNRLMLHVGYAF